MTPLPDWNDPDGGRADRARTAETPPAVTAATMPGSTTGPARESPFTPSAPDITAPTITLPTSGGAIRGIGEKFTANPATGTGSMTVPIVTSTGRSAFGPTLSLSYDSGRGNGPFGFGWALSIPAITRRTDTGLPRYNDSDVFLLSDAEDLVPALAPEGADGSWTPIVAENPVHAPGFRIERYRPRIEGLFARIERWTRLADGDVHWCSVTRDNIANWYGLTPNSRVADPADPARIFTWLLCRSEDRRGNAIGYDYFEENGAGVDLAAAHEAHRAPVDRGANRYIKRIRYGNRVSVLVQPDAADPGWMFEVVFDYGEHDPSAPTPTPIRPATCRPDPFSTYRAGFDVRSYRMCERVLMFHHFPAENDVGMDCLVNSTDLEYQSGDAVGQFLTSVTHAGYRRDGSGYRRRSMPSVEFGYTPALLQAQLRELDPESVQNLPAGLSAAGHRWADLDGQGLPGVLVTGTDCWYYKANHGDGRLGPLQPLPALPSAAAAGATGPRLLDLDGNGHLDLVTVAGSTPGYLERTSDGNWTPWRPFSSAPTVGLDDPALRWIDLDGDGRSDLLVADRDALTWYPSRGPEGFGPGISLATDIEAGPVLVSADLTGSIYQADMTGDGLADLVRVRNGSVCYWPNIGYGRFGAMVTMDDAPVFDSMDRFDPQRLLLADVDGSGPADLIYLGSDSVRVHRSRSGNGWLPAVSLPGLPPHEPDVAVAAVDVLGTGTISLVWSSRHPGDDRRSMRFADLMGGVKPHLLERVVNNLGAETVVRYAPSTRFSLADQAAGRGWVTQLPFPVQVVERVETYDRISGNRLVNRFAYHHGHFDGIDREFRGFGMTEKWDTEELSALGTVDLTSDPAADLDSDPTTHVPPVLTRTWFHTGAFVDVGPLQVERFAGEYWRDPGLAAGDVDGLPGSVLPDTLLLQDGTRLPHRPDTDELREAHRSLKGSLLREEIFALDGSATAELPFLVTDRRWAVELLQPKGSGEHAVCMSRPSESTTRHFERRTYSVELTSGPAERTDPRIWHELTLDVDGTGAVTRGACVAYGRRYPDADLDPLLPVWAADALTGTQAAMLATVTENRFTTAVDEPGGYRTSLPAETRTYELVDIDPPTHTLLVLDEVRATCDIAGDGAHDLPAAQTTTDPTAPARAEPHRRLIEHDRFLYRRDDLAGPLPLGQAEPLGLADRNYRLTLTSGVIASVYRRRTADGTAEGIETVLLPEPATVLGPDGGYVAGEELRAVGLFPPDDPDGQWWAPTGRLLYSPDARDGTDPPAELAFAVAHFFLPGGFVDPFGHVATLHHDEYDLLPVRLADALGNLTTAGERGPGDELAVPGNDYRVLAPWLVSDANRNRTAVSFDALGLVAGTAVQGKPDEGWGDTLVGFEPDPDDEVIAEYFADPLGRSAALLGQATTRHVYDLHAYARSRAAIDPQPGAVSTLARETHESEPGGASTEIRRAVSYSDGFRRVIQRKEQADPGPIAPGDAETDPRWTCSGWTLFDSKANPVRRYEPFFTGTHRFEAHRQVGVSSILLYDPLGRVVATVHPDHTWEKVVVDPWRQQEWDRSDTILIADPGQDPDIGGRLAQLPESDYLPGWYEHRMAGVAGTPERVAAEQAATHAGTPRTAIMDPLARTFATVTHNRTARSDAPVTELPPESRQVTVTVLDIEGNQRATIDAHGRTVLRSDYDMTGHALRTHGMDSGERWILGDLAAHPIRLWDSRDHLLRIGYDALRRPLETHLYTGAGAAFLVGRTVYGESQLDPEAHNLRGRPFQAYDGAGVIVTGDYDNQGNPVRSSRQLTVDYRSTPDWSVPVPLESEIFDSGATFDALDRPVTLTLPDGTVITPAYTRGNQLRSVSANLRGETLGGRPVWTSFVTAIDYDARGRRAGIAYGNGVASTVEYDPLTFRVTRVRTARSTTGVQDLTYTYDSMGNVTDIRDAAQQTVFFRNTAVTPDVAFAYDATYQLIEATGREHLGQLAGPVPPDAFDAARTGLPQPGDGAAMARYVQRYVYDEVGNFLEIRHAGSDPTQPGWTRRFAYDDPSGIEPDRTGNRLNASWAGSGGRATHGYDAHGNMTSMSHLPLMRWNHVDRLAATSQQVVVDGTPETTYYVYDAAGQRVRKVTDRAAPAGATPARKLERITLGGFDLYRAYDGAGTVSLQRESAHLLDGDRRIALVETRTQGDDGSPERLTRYQIGNHLDTVSLELDDAGRVISYEEFHPFGSTAYQAVDRDIRAAAKRYRYTGKERDEETGLACHGARYYAGWLGRWCSVDPIGVVAGINGYRYVHNRPIGRADPTGMADTPALQPEKKGFPVLTGVNRTPNPNGAIDYPDWENNPQERMLNPDEFKDASRPNVEVHHVIRDLGPAGSAGRFGPGAHSFVLVIIQDPTRFNPLDDPGLAGRLDFQDKVDAPTQYFHKEQAHLLQTGNGQSFFTISAYKANRVESLDSDRFLDVRINEETDRVDALDYIRERVDLRSTLPGGAKGYEVQSSVPVEKMVESLLELSVNYDENGTSNPYPGTLLTVIVTLAPGWDVTNSNSFAASLLTYAGATNVSGNMWGADTGMHMPVPEKDFAPAWAIP